MPIFDSEIMEKANAMGGAWIKAPEFDGDGLVLQIKATEKIKGQYGASADDSIVERGLLEEGESFRYTFEDATGAERKHDSASFPLFIGMQQAELNFGDWLHIKREGKTDKTRYTVEVVEAPKVLKSVEYPISKEDESLDASDVGF